MVRNMVSVIVISIRVWVSILHMGTLDPLGLSHYNMGYIKFRV